MSSQLPGQPSATVINSRLSLKGFIFSVKNAIIFASIAPRRISAKSQQSKENRDMKKQVAIMKVGTGSDPNKVAGAIAGCIRENGAAMIRTIGAGALNQAIKAIAVATVFLKEGGIQLCVRPIFTDLSVGGRERTAISLVLEHRVEDPAHPIPVVEFVEKLEQATATRGGQPFFRRKGDKTATA